MSAAPVAHAIGLDDALRRVDALEEEARHRALHDPLTGLPNRTLFVDRVHHALALAARNGGTAAVIGIDIDRFKVVNERHGHERGDELLLELAQRLGALLSPGDTLARLGGDEFVGALRGPPRGARGDRESRSGCSTAWRGRSCSATSPSSSTPASASRSRTARTPRPRRSCATPAPRCRAPRPRAARATSSSTPPSAAAWPSAWRSRTTSASRSSATSSSSTTSRSSTSTSAGSSPSRGSCAGATRARASCSRASS